MSASGQQAALPSVISNYQAAHDLRDVPRALACFADQAVVTDDGRTYDGKSAIADFIANAASEFTFTRTLKSWSFDAEQSWIVTSLVEGNFPGGSVDLRYRFQLQDELIWNLDIAP